MDDRLKRMTELARAEDAARRIRQDEARLAAKRNDQVARTAPPVQQAQRVGGYNQVLGSEPPVRGKYNSQTSPIPPVLGWDGEFTRSKQSPPPAGYENVAPGSYVNTKVQGQEAIWHRGYLYTKDPNVKTRDHSAYNGWVDKGDGSSPRRMTTSVQARVVEAGQNVRRTVTDASQVFNPNAGNGFLKGTRIQRDFGPRDED